MLHVEEHTMSYPRGEAPVSAKPDIPGVIVRPPRLYLAALIIGIAADSVAPVASFPVWLSFGVGAVLIVGSISLLALAMRYFGKAETNVPTTMPTTALVMEGPHRYSRNPIYLALTLIYVGIACSASSVFALILLLPVLSIMRYGVIAHEERYLEAKFGEAYRAYKTRTRRWI